VLKKKKIEIKSSDEARNRVIGEDEAWAILKGAKQIVVASGKKTIELDTQKHSKEEILSLCLGRSGTLRAPTLKIGNKFFVGYSEEVYSLL